MKILVEVDVFDEPRYEGFCQSIGDDCQFLNESADFCYLFAKVLEQDYESDYYLKCDSCKKAYQKALNNK